MATMERSGTPADVAAERAAIEAEIEGSTLLTAYARTVAAAGDTVAHRWLEGGQWRSLTYRQVHDQVRDVALGLGVVGLRPGEFAVIWSRNRSEATVADYAVMHAGGVPVFIYTTVSAEQAAYIAGHCEATVAIVEREFLPKLRLGPGGAAEAAPDHRDRRGGGRRDRLAASCSASAMVRPSARLACSSRPGAGSPPLIWPR